MATFLTIVAKIYNFLSFNVYWSNMIDMKNVVVSLIPIQKYCVPAVIKRRDSQHKEHRVCQMKSNLFGFLSNKIS